MLVTICMHEAGVVWIENPHGAPLPAFSSRRRMRLQMSCGRWGIRR